MYIQVILKEFSIDFFIQIDVDIHFIRTFFNQKVFFLNLACYIKFNTIRKFFF